MNRVILKGDIPSPVNPPRGCKFHTRCDKCTKACEYITPEFKEVEPGHFCACHLYESEEELESLIEHAERMENEEKLAAIEQGKA